MDVISIVAAFTFRFNLFALPSVMHRRTFIKISGITTAISLTPWLSSCTSEPKEILSTPATLETFCNHEELLMIGKAYCDMHPDECNQPSLEKLLLNDGAGKSFEATDPSLLGQFLHQKITDEFKRGDLAIVKGWVLSRTEARQIALYSLLS